MVEPTRKHTRFERARIIGARALQIGMGAPLNVTEEELREAFRAELISLFGVDEANTRFVLDPLKIALYEYDNNLIPIDVDPHLS
jgi:DNA-directed RNA polymerase subunit K